VGTGRLREFRQIGPRGARGPRGTAAQRAGGGGPGAEQRGGRARARGGGTAGNPGATSRAPRPAPPPPQVGTDSSGAYLRGCLEERGVGLAGLRVAEGPSGTAIVLLERATRENRIVIVGGANTAGAGLDDAQLRLIEGAGMVLLQREVPGETNLAAARAARAARVPVLMDAGGEDAPLPDELLALLDTFSPNETELARISGMPAGDEAQAEAAARALLARGAQRVLVKRGTRGSLLVDAGGVTRCGVVPAARVVDTTGAGDSFTAGYAVATLEGRAPADAMLFGAAVASLVVGRMGAMSSLPSRAEVDALLASGTRGVAPA